jgi:hypothetical protein
MDSITGMTVAAFGELTVYQWYMLMGMLVILLSLLRFKILPRIV